jgi:hypothetical protein
MAKESIAVLHLASLEETRTEEEKPNPLRNRTRDGLRLESDKNGRMGCSSESYSAHYNNHQTIKDEGLC